MVQPASPADTLRRSSARTLPRTRPGIELAASFSLPGVFFIGVSFAEKRALRAHCCVGRLSLASMNYARILGNSASDGYAMRNTEHSALYQQRIAGAALVGQVYGNGYPGGGRVREVLPLHLWPRVW